MGLIEPQSRDLKLPPNNSLLYKIIKIEDLIRSILGGYLYFNRVDSYKGYKNSDPTDSEQLPLDRPGNASSKFEKDPTFSAENYHDTARKRTYACCFSLENSDYIWKNYGKGSY